MAIRSAVFPGVVERDVIPLLSKLSGKLPGEQFGVCLVPEFLRESTLLEDLVYPPFTLIGASDHASGQRVASLFARLGPPIELTTIPVAEMARHVCNAFHALKVCFANEVVNLSRALGIDGNSVMEILCKDTRPSLAFGGDCLPNGLGATIHKARQLGVKLPMLASLLRSSRMQIELALNLVESAGKSRVGILGLGSGAGNENLRRSPTVRLIERLVGRGYKLAIYDERVALAKPLEASDGLASQKLAPFSPLMAHSPRDVIQSSDLIIVTKVSPQIQEAVANEAEGKIVVDLVRLLRRTPRQAAYCRTLRSSGQSRGRVPERTRFSQPSDSLSR